MMLLAGAGFVDFSFHLPRRGFVLCADTGHPRSTKSASSAEAVRVGVRKLQPPYRRPATIAYSRTDRGVPFSYCPEYAVFGATANKHDKPSGHDLDTSSAAVHVKFGLPTLI